MLYRLTYALDGRVAGATYWAATNEEADRFSQWWEDSYRRPVLTVKCLGHSKFNPPPQGELELVS